MKSRILKMFTATNAFIFFAMVFGLIFVFATPLLWGADETSHVGRVYQLAHGHILAKEVHDKDSYSSYGFGGQFPESVKSIVNYVNYDFNVNSHQAITGIKWVDIPADYTKFFNTKMDGPLVDYNFSNTAIYSPLSYVPAVIAFLIAGALHLNFGPTLYLARIFDLITYVAIFAFLINSLRKYKLKWAFIVLGLLPASLYQASTVSADPITIALSFVIVGLVLKSLLIKEKLSKLDTIALGISVILLPITKPTYIFISFLALLVPSRIVPLSKKYARFLMPTVVVIGLIVYAIWQLKTGYLSNAAKWIIAGVVPWWQHIDSSAQISHVINNPVEFAKTFLRTVLIGDNNYLSGLFGRLGFTSLDVPAMAIVTTFTAFVLSILQSETFTRTKKQLIFILCVLAITVAAVFGTLYLTISEVGQLTIQGVQGRYLIPALAVLTMFLILLTRLRLYVRNKLTYQHLTYTILGLSVFSLIVTVVKFIYIIWG